MIETIIKEEPAKDPYSDKRYRYINGERYSNSKKDSKQYREELKIPSKILRKRRE